MYPLIPDRFPVLKAPGLTLRAPLPVDGDAWFARLNDPESLAMAGDDPVTDREVIDELLESITESFEAKERIRWGIVPDGIEHSIGTIGFALDWEDRRADIGGAIGRDYWGQGIMVRAAAAIVSYGFEKLDLRRIQADIWAENTRSRRVVEKLGFALEGTRRQYSVVNGEPADFLMFAALQDEWRPPR